MSLMIAAGITTGQIVGLVLAGFLLTIVMLSTHRRTRKSRALSGRSVAERYRNLKDERAATRDIDQVMLDLDRLSRDIQARFDTRLARLECLIRDADQRIAQLSRCAPETEGAASFDVTLDDEQPTAPEGAATTNAAGHHAVYRLADDGLSNIEIAERVGRPHGEVELILGLRRASARPADVAIATSADRSEQE